MGLQNLIPFFPADARKFPSGCQENVTRPTSCLSAPTLKSRLIRRYQLGFFQNLTGDYRICVVKSLNYDSIVSSIVDFFQDHKIT
jgi:hypothetical protein